MEFGTILQNIALWIAGITVGACMLGFAILALMNLWGILDPRMGQAVKGGLLRVFLSAGIMGGVAGTPAVLTAMGIHFGA